MREYILRSVSIDVKIELGSMEVFPNRFTCSWNERIFCLVLYRFRRSIHWLRWNPIGATSSISDWSVSMLVEYSYYCTVVIFLYLSLRIWIWSRVNRTYGYGLQVSSMFNMFEDIRQTEQIAISHCLPSRKKGKDDPCRLRGIDLDCWSILSVIW